MERKNNVEGENVISLVTSTGPFQILSKLRDLIRELTGIIKITLNVRLSKNIRHNNYLPYLYKDTSSHNNNSRALLQL